jgi:hypothetical protein
LRPSHNCFLYYLQFRQAIVRGPLWNSIARTGVRTAWDLLEQVGSIKSIFTIACLRVQESNIKWFTQMMCSVTILCLLSVLGQLKIFSDWPIFYIAPNTQLFFFKKNLSKNYFMSDKRGSNLPSPNINSFFLWVNFDTKILFPPPTPHSLSLSLSL